ncbi:MAG: HAD family phosphatase [Campylobacter sp.]|uniref:HAD family hydrolase n=1 Tax=Campylobacter sp. TaxID=205 RepID=UPI002A81CB64|nr:HAD family phosphatase [Campylobacter sp.]MDY5114507.1 HAD family phosphatase [Campylobacter sp.]
MRDIFIFDFDGVIVDSVSALKRIYYDFLAQFDKKGNDKEFDSLNGVKLADIIKTLKSNYKLALSEKTLFDIYNQKIMCMYENVALNKGVARTLEFLSNKGYKIALASSAKYLEIITVLNRYKLTNFFDLIVSGDDVKRAKPLPDIYNAVKNKLGKANYFVVEDSLNGAISAKDAGMNVIFYGKTKFKYIYIYIYIYCITQILDFVLYRQLGCICVTNTDKIKIKLLAKKLKISEKKEKIVDEIWQNESKKRKLFNGKILSLSGYFFEKNSFVIECFEVEYKYFLANLKADFLNLNIKPIGISGIIVDELKQTLVATRQNVTLYNGFYELIPSGSLETSGHKILYKNDLKRELKQEAGILDDKILAITPLCFCLDTKQNVYDICAKICIKNSLNNILKFKNNSEYKNIQIKNIDSIFVKKYDFVPTSSLILHILKNSYHKD